MSAPDNRQRELRAEAFPQLPGSDFDDMLATLRTHHSAHEPLEIDSTPSVAVMRDRTLQHQLATIKQRSLTAMQERHRTELVGVLCAAKPDISAELAEAIIDEFVLNE